MMGFFGNLVTIACFSSTTNGSFDEDSIITNDVREDVIRTESGDVILMETE